MTVNLHCIKLSTHSFHRHIVYVYTVCKATPMCAWHLLRPDWLSTETRVQLRAVTIRTSPAQT